MLKSFDRDVGWIDFEQEISYVISCFERVIPDKGTSISYKTHKNSKYVVETFDFLIDKVATQNAGAIGSKIVGGGFCIEHPVGSGQRKVSKEKIAAFLSKELLDLSRALRIYLSCFVESTYDLLREEKTCQRIPIFNHIDKTITFNYTNTYETIYLKGKAFHIHGSLGDEIVLLLLWKA